MAVRYAIHERFGSYSSFERHFENNLIGLIAKIVPPFIALMLFTLNKSVLVHVKLMSMI